MRLVPPLRQQRDRDAIRAGARRRHDRRAGQRPHAGRRGREAPAVRRGRARRDRPRAAARPRRSSGARRAGSALAQTLARGDQPAGGACSARARWRRRRRRRAACARARVADLCVFDPDERGRSTARRSRSRSKHTPFAGHEMPGRVRCTLVAGRGRLRRGGVTPSSGVVTAARPRALARLRACRAATACTAW